MSIQQSEILIIGHRGAMGHCTENTIASIEKALELQCDMIEIDVYKIKTGEIVVFHDRTLDRMTNKKANIESLCYDNLQNVIIKGGHKIPTLQKAIETINQRAVLNIELKGVDTAKSSYDIIQIFIKNGFKKENFLFSSFNWSELSDIHLLDPSFPLAVLTKGKPEQAISFAKLIQAKAINPSFRNLNKKNIQLIKEQGLKVYPWTVNTPRDIQRMKSLEVDGIITNFPERI